MLHGTAQVREEVAGIVQMEAMEALAMVEVAQGTLKKRELVALEVLAAEVEAAISLTPKLVMQAVPQVAPEGMATILAQKYVQEALKVKL